MPCALILINTRVKNVFSFVYYLYLKSGQMGITCFEWPAGTGTVFNWTIRFVRLRFSEEVCLFKPRLIQIIHYRLFGLVKILPSLLYVSIEKTEQICCGDRYCKKSFHLIIYETINLYYLDLSTQHLVEKENNFWSVHPCY